MKQRFDLAVIGGGAAGLLLLWHRLHLPHPPRNVLWLDEVGRFAHGPAYATRWPQHLLNVPAAKMGALPEAPEGFLTWLHSDTGRAAAGKHGLAHAWQPGDYTPRLLFGAYLESFRQALHQHAISLGIALHEERAQITGIEPAPEGYLLQSAEGIWQAHALALAMGNQPHPPWNTPMWENAPHPRWLGRMWDWSAAEPAPPPTLPPSPLPALILGSGLTGVDAVLQLRASGWRGRIEMLSRRAALPAAHGGSALAAAIAPQWPAPGARLSAYIQAFRDSLAGQQDWRAAMDALRPHTTHLWQRLSAQDQRRFWMRLGPIWNTHRHRMAPSIAQILAQEMASGALRLRPFTIARLQGEEDHIAVQDAVGYMRQGALVVDCTGPSYDLRHRPGPLSALLETQAIQRAPNGLGLAMDKLGLVRAATAQAGPIVALGALGVGARLESTAIPELRVQAAAAAFALSEG